MLHGPGTYSFRVHGAKDQALFRSVFEYDYFCQLLSNIEGTHLIAYVFSEYQAQWIMECERDWQDVLDDIKAASQESYFQVWHKHHQQISEDAEVIFIDAEQYLVPAVMAMHYWPVSQKLVARPEAYPWSSDRHYRSTSAPAWLNADLMLKRLVHQRFNTALRYERMMDQYTATDLSSHYHRLYLALAGDSKIARHLQKHRQKTPLSEEACMAMRTQAEHLVNQTLGIQPSDGISETPRQRRQFHQTEPLSMWLLAESGWSVKQLAWVFDTDETVLQAWLRSIHANHPAGFLNSLKARWREDLRISTAQNPDELSVESPIAV